MKFFFGAAIQGHQDWGGHADVYSKIMQTIKSNNGTVLSEHTSGQTRSETLQKLAQSIGPLPKDEYQSRVFVRDKMIEMLERDDLSGIIFEVSVPSLGTGVEIAHAYLREQLGFRPVPILALYREDYWPNKLSSMIRGISPEKYPNFHLREYDDLARLEEVVQTFVETCKEFELTAQ